MSNLVIIFMIFMYNSSVTKSSIDIGLQKYVKEYKKDKLKYLGEPMSDVTIHFTRFPSNAIVNRKIRLLGYCYYDSNLILIDKTYWYDHTTTELERKELIYHELGHCDLKMRHNKDKKSLMYKYKIKIMTENELNDVIEKMFKSVK